MVAAPYGISTRSHTIFTIFIEVFKLRLSFYKIFFLADYLSLSRTIHIVYNMTLICESNFQGPFQRRFKCTIDQVATKHSRLGRFRQDLQDSGNSFFFENFSLPLNDYSNIIKVVREKLTLFSSLMLTHILLHFYKSPNHDMSSKNIHHPHQGVIQPPSIP